MALHAHRQAADCQPRRLDAREVRRHQPRQPAAGAAALRRMGMGLRGYLDVERERRRWSGMVACAASTIPDTRTNCSSPRLSCGCWIMTTEPPLHEGGYAQQSWTAGDRPSALRAPARVGTITPSTGRSVVSPQASAAVILAGSTRLQLGWGQYVQFPRFPISLRLGRRASAAACGPTRRSPRWSSAWASARGCGGVLRAGGPRPADRPFYDPRILNGKVFVPPLNPPLRQLRARLRARIRVSRSNAAAPTGSPDGPPTLTA